MEKALLNLKEFCTYVGIKETTARKILSSRDCPFSMKVGSKWFVSKKHVDKWIDENCKKFW